MPDDKDLAVGCLVCVVMWLLAIPLLAATAGISWRLFWYFAEP